MWVCVDKIQQRLKAECSNDGKNANVPEHNDNVSLSVHNNPCTTSFSALSFLCLYSNIDGGTLEQLPPFVTVSANFLLFHSWSFTVTEFEKFDCSLIDSFQTTPADVIRF